MYHTLFKSINFDNIVEHDVFVFHWKSFFWKDDEVCKYKLREAKSISSYTDIL